MPRTLRLLALVLAFGAAAWAGDPKLEPLTGLPPFPEDNPPSAEKIELGRRLFFDTKLSGEGRRSCSTCHKPELYFTDGFSRAWGLNEQELRRKSPSLLNVGWQRSMFFDSREKTLEDQAFGPVAHPFELGSSPDEAARKVSEIVGYRQAFARVFPGEPITFELIAKAIASYERTLISVDSDLDRYLLGDEDALTPAAKRGMALFTGRAGCIQCHNGPLLTDHQRHYTGVPETMGDNEPGFKYKTQSLRDVLRRYSFMHNGSMLKIDEVLDHYARGGSAPEGLEAEIRPVELSADDRADLLAFLEALNGRPPDHVLESQASADVFDARRIPVTGADEDAAADAPKGPVQDPAYMPKKP